MHSSPFQVLVIEGDRGDSELIQRALEESGLNFCLRSVKNGSEMTTFLQKQRPSEASQFPDLILINLKSSTEGYFQTLREIKSSTLLKMIPVIIISEETQEDDIISSYDLGANCYVIRPMNHDKLLAVLERIIEFWLTIAQLPTRPS